MAKRSPTLADELRYYQNRANFFGKLNTLASKGGDERRRVLAGPRDGVLFLVKKAKVEPRGKRSEVVSRKRSFSRLCAAQTSWLSPKTPTGQQINPSNASNLN